MSRTFKIRTTEGKAREIAMPAKPRVPLGKKAKPREQKTAPKQEPKAEGKKNA